MKIETIKIQNFLSFQNAEYNFSDQGLSLFTGVNHDVAERSNGTGKTSVIEALLWVLFGETSKSLKSDDVINRDAGKDCVVSVKIEGAGGEYIITRCRKHSKFKNDLIFEHNGNNISAQNSTETQEKINYMLGLDFKIFTNAVIFPQESKFKFIGATDNEKKDILTDILDLHFIDEAYDKLMVDHKTTQQQINNLNVQNDEINKFLTDLVNEQENNKLQAEQWEDNRQVEINHHLETLKAAQSKLKTLQDKLKVNNISNIQQNIETKQGKIDGIEINLEKMDSIQHAFYKKQFEINTLNKQMQEDANKINKIDNIGVGECPKCSQNVSESHLEALKKEIVQNIDSKNIILAEKESELVQLQVKVDKVKQIKTLQKKLSHEIEQHKQALRDIKEQESQLEREKVKIENIENLIDMHSKMQNPHINKNQGDKIKEYKKKNQANQKKLDNLHDVLLYMDFWRNGFSNRGIKSFIFDNVLFELNSKVEEYLDELFDGQLKVVFDSESKTQKGEVRQKLNTSIQYNGVDVDYNSLSGGEKRSVSLTVDLALSYIVSQYNQKNYDLLVFDESTDHLDLYGKEKFLELLKKLDKGTILVISHDLQFQTKFDSVQKVIKKNNVSTLL